MPILSTSTLKVHCVACSEPISRLSPEIGDWWDIGFHCDACGQHTLVHARYRKDGVYIETRAWTCPASIEASPIRDQYVLCGQCGATPDERSD